jgi:hypothetical protein
MGATAAPILAGTLARIWPRRDHVAGGGGQRPVISGRTFSSGDGTRCDVGDQAIDCRKRARIVGLQRLSSDSPGIFTGSRPRIGRAL